MEAHALPLDAKEAGCRELLWIFKEALQGKKKLLNIRSRQRCRIVNAKLDTVRLTGADSPGYEVGVLLAFYASRETDEMACHAYSLTFLKMTDVSVRFEITLYCPGGKSRTRDTGVEAGVRGPGKPVTIICVPKVG